MAEITEVFVDKKHRRRKNASKMISFDEMYCMEQYALHKIELLTRKENFVAQALYQTKGYHIEDEILLVKRL